MDDTYWEEEARRMTNNVEFWRGLVVEVAEILGPAAYTADDGSVYDTPVALKVPELVAALKAALPATPSTTETGWAIRHKGHGKWWIGGGIRWTTRVSDASLYDTADNAFTWSPYRERPNLDIVPLTRTLSVQVGEPVQERTERT